MNSSPAGGAMPSEVAVPPAVHTRSCEVCKREGIRLPVCATCQRDLKKVVFVSFRRASA